MIDLFSVPVSDHSQIGEARRQATLLAETLRFDTTASGEVAIIVTEAATNLARHARGGEIIFRALHSDRGEGLEMLALDRGPGIANISQVMNDGFSTGTTPGNGLGAIRRLSSEFDLYSSAAGTALLSRRWAKPASPKPPVLREAFDWGVVCLPVRGEEVPGDSWAVEPNGPGRAAIIVADGLGHGLAAADASRLAVKICRENLQLDPVRRMEAMHAALRSTRGAAVSLIDLRLDRGELSFTGVGNVSASVVTPRGVRHLVCHNGTVGAELRRVQEFTEPWPSDGLLLVFSDGLSTQWRLESYPGLAARHPSLIAATLYRDFRRERDDVTVLAARTIKP